MSMVVILLCSINSYAQLVDDGQDNILKYKNYRPVYQNPWAKDSLRPLYMNLSAGAEGLFHNTNIKWANSLNMSMRLGVGYWISSVSGIEAAASYNSNFAGLLSQNYDERSLVDANTADWTMELNYLFNFTNFSSKAAKRNKFTVVGGIGLNYRFDTKADISSYGTQLLLRLAYAPTNRISFFLEPKASFSKNNFKSSISNYGYYIQPSVSLGMNIALYNFNESKQEKAILLPSKEQQLERQLFKIKTNLLYDVILVPNISIEVPIKDRWSVGMELLSSWWLNKDDTQCLQTEYLGLEGRYYWGKFSHDRVNTGWFAGLYGGMGRYDIQIYKDRGIQSEMTYTVGGAIGYSLTVSRYMNLEFELGLGYIQSDYYKYMVRSDRLVKDGGLMRYSAFIPTKAGVSLVWVISMKKKNKEGEL